MRSKSKAGVGFSARKIAGGALTEGVKAPRCRYSIICRDRRGRVKWREEFSNLVTAEGNNDVLSKYLKGSSYTAAWYVGLKGSGSPASGDTLASHAGWSEISDYSGSRKALVLGSVASGSVDNSASVAEFTINASGTAHGAFIASAASGTSGILYSVGNFSASKAFTSGDKIQVTVTLTHADDGV